MRRLEIIAAAMVALGAAQVSAQEWATYTNRVDRFEVNFPGSPKVDDITWPSEYGAVFPGRVYSLTQNASRYSVTVIDYTDAERIHAARTNRTEADSLPIYWQIDVQASIAYAATKFRERAGVKVTYDAFHYIDLVSGHQLQINPHTWIYIEVKDGKGEPTMWALEGASVIQLERRGWKKDMFKIGSTIGVRCHQLRDKSSGCLLGFITLEGAAEKMFD